MSLDYLHLRPGQTPPARPFGPFRAVVIAELDVNNAWRNAIAKWLVKGGCLYMVAWGVACSQWDDAVDWALLEEFDFGEIPDERFVMTTWHEGVPLSEALWFAGQCAHQRHVELRETLIVHIAQAERRESLLRTYADSQILADK